MGSPLADGIIAYRNRSGIPSRNVESSIRIVKDEREVGDVGVPVERPDG